jgi:hypothetical protein
MTDNDVLALNREFEKWKAERAVGLPPKTNAFEVFCSEQFLKQYPLLSDQDILSGIVGSTDDGGVDSFYLIVNGHLVREDSNIPSHPGAKVSIIIIQSKENKGFAPTQVDKFDTFTEDCFDLNRLPDKYGRKYHEKLLDMMNVFKQKYQQLSLPETTVDYFYITRADVIENDGCEKSARKVEDKAKHYFSRATVNPIHFVNGAGLYTQVQLRPPTTKELHFVDWVDSPEGYIGLVPLAEFAKFLGDGAKRRDDRMFDDNVRGFYRDTLVNRSILITLQHPDKMPEFWLLNNGVTVLSSHVQPKTYRVLEITDPQVVNGLQTSRQIIAYFDDNAPPKDDPRRILVRVIQNSDEDVRDKIIKATNYQNPMPAESLFTTFRIHKQIESVFQDHNLFYERRRGFWKDQRKPMAQILSVKELMQAVIAVMTDRQDDARGRPLGYISDKEKRWMLFGHDDYDDTFIMTEQDVISRPPYDIKVYLNCVKLVRRTDQFLTVQPKLTNEDKRNIRFYLVKYLACKAIGSAYCVPGQIATLNADAMVDSLIDEPFKKVRRLYRLHGGDDDAGRSPDLSSALNKLLIREFSPPNKRKKRTISVTAD